VIGFLSAMLVDLKRFLKPGCSHSCWISIDESGDGEVIELKCVSCGKVKIEDE